MIRLPLNMLCLTWVLVGFVPWAQSEGLPLLESSVGPNAVIHHPTPRLLDGFGLSMSQHQGKIVIGAPNAINQGRETGLTYLFDVQGQLAHTFELPVTISGALFGQAVALSSQSIIIGAPHGRDALNTQTGVVYLFNRQSKLHRLTLNNPNPSSGVFGHALAVSEGNVLVGDPQASTATSSHRGAVYIFDEASGALRQTLGPKSKAHARPTQFGHAVSMVGQQVFIAAPFGGADGSEAGMVYQFNVRTGDLIRTFVPPSGMGSLLFGWSMAVNSDVIVIGAFGFQGTYRDEGIVYMYHIQSGKLLQTFANPNPTERARFGKSVALLPEAIVVSAPGDRVQENGKIKGGVVYMFHPDSGVLLKSLQEPIPMTGASDMFGDALFVDGETLLVGAPFGGIGSELDAGLVYQYQSQMPQ